MNESLDLLECKLSALSIHAIGNKGHEEPNRFSDSPIPLKDDSIQQVLMTYFLNPMLKAGLYTFDHAFELDQNEIYHLAKQVLNASQDATFHEASVQMGKHLYEITNHPQIKSGELYIAYFDSLVFEDEMVDAIGIFKSETRDTFLKVYPEGQNFGIASEEGININKLDKGALILNTEEENGFVVAVVDNTNKSQDAKYWKEDFLGVKQREDNFYHTENILKMSKDFAKDAFSKDDRIERVDFVNRSMEYFSENELFSNQDFEEKVLKEPELIESFENFKSNYTHENRMSEAEGEFEISAPAVKKAKRYIKSVIKLDKNFHVYVHGDKEKIERGYDDEKSLNFYKIYFQDEH